MDDKIVFQNKVLRYVIVVQVILLALLTVVMSVYIADTANLRREMLEYARESIRQQHEQLMEKKEETLSRGYEELEQLERLIDDYKNNSMEMDDLLRGMETEIDTIRERS